MSCAHGRFCHLKIFPRQQKKSLRQENFKSCLCSRNGISQRERGPTMAARKESTRKKRLRKAPVPKKVQIPSERSPNRSIVKRGFPRVFDCLGGLDSISR